MYEVMRSSDKFDHLIDGQLSILEGYIIDYMVEGCMVE